MAIAQEISADFGRKTKERGQEYFREGRVTITHAEPDHVAARVRGSATYKVDVYLGDDPADWEFECSCPVADEWGGPCKHIWATLLQAEQQGILGAAARAGGANGDGGSNGDGESNGDEVVVGFRTPSSSSPPSPSSSSSLSGKPSSSSSSSPSKSAPTWKKALAQLRKRDANFGDVGALQPPPPFPSDRRIVYVIDVGDTLAGRGLTVEVCTQKARKPGTGGTGGTGGAGGAGGAWERPKAFSLDVRQWQNAPDESDRLIAQMLIGAHDVYGYGYGAGSRKFVIPGAAYETTLRRMCDTGRCGLRREPKQETFDPLTWDDRPAWELCLQLARSAGERNVIVTGHLCRGEQTMPMNKPVLILAEGLVITHTLIARLNYYGAWQLAQFLRKGGELKASVGELDELLKELSAQPHLPKLIIDPALGDIAESAAPPVCHLKISRPRTSLSSDESLQAELSFDYGGVVFTEGRASSAAHYDPGVRKLVRRDPAAEARAVQRLMSLGVRREWSFDANGLRLRLHASLLNRVVLELIRAGWQVEAEGSVYRRPGSVRVQVQGSGIDWFELQGGIEFDGKLVPMPRLLEAMRRGDKWVKLDDGAIGVLPEDWLSKYAPLAGVGEEAGDTLRFAKSQIGFLDALLATMPDARCDETFQRVRDEMRAFQSIEPADAPAGFVGELRPYQCDGLGWLHFLQRFGFGGCLADDMGLGKTVQVLALLEERRQAKAGASLVVVPRSLVFNWKAEAQRFAPKLRVLDHSGIARNREADEKHFNQYDLIITTYGTLRRDAAIFKDITFDYAILDEAQAIKNANTDSAKAARLLRARHRLALSGTPVENRLAELWSLFEFLNPGMLGTASVFKGLVGNEQGSDGRELLARALRPFLLRRTKGQVAKELPEKLEQTIYCDLEAGQRKLYDELREHYRQSLLGRIESLGLNKSKMQVLEALLRLRQAACHPGLIDKERGGEPSAKLDALFEHLEDVLSEGHKVLVFSQFTSFLALLRKRLDAAQTTYEYLDGKTRDRQAKVERFQADQSCKLFLISLKAGGTGLNLTAADYVFLLDPWWNPAVESQAIDRTHRIGQTRRVFAYRLIARDTVEEKVLQLQQSKRELADAIITADNSVISKLKREDLELLLS